MRWGLAAAAAFLRVLWIARAARAAEEVTKEPADENEVRSYDGTGNNEGEPDWGSVGQRQLRSLAPANYTDGVSTPPGDTRPSPRKLLSDVFLATPPTSSLTSALFIGWGLLVGFDLVLTQDNTSEPFNVDCNDPTLADIWCPSGSESTPISFNRSQAEVDAVADGGDGARSPINYATAYVDLDWLYGRDVDAADALRTFEGGFLNLTDEALPHLLEDGSWLVADQRPARFPVTFALMTLLLREHNRCCNELVEGWDASGDEEAYQFCRQWNIAVFQHITENDFSTRFIGGSIKTLGSDAYETYHADDDDDGAVTSRRRRLERHWRLGALEHVTRSRYLAQTSDSYDETTDAGVDVFFSTVLLPAFYSALPPIVALRDEDFEAIDEHGIELASASADIAGLISRSGGIEPIIRGASYSRTQAFDTSFASEISASSLLFNFPVEVVQRGRDHGLPNYNDAREAYGFSRFTTFADITSDATVQELLSDAYGDVDNLDAFTGAIAEVDDGSAMIAGPLLQAVFLEQLYRAIVGDRHHHCHSTQNENATLSTLSTLALENTLITYLPLDTFSTPDFVASSNCSSTEANQVNLAEGYKLAWNYSADTTGEMIRLTLSARSVGDTGMIGIGFGGMSMRSATDFVICEVLPDDGTECLDYGETDDRALPPLDEGDGAMSFVVSTSVDGEWTSVTFDRVLGGNDDSDYPLRDDIDAKADTDVIFSWRSGEGLQQHPNGQRGSAKVNFVDGTVVTECDDSSEYYAFHGALLLLAWMIVAPYGIYQARYRKGLESITGSLWWEVHEECMIICSEAVLPLGITAILTTGGSHNSQHAKWGFYMMAAVFMQLLTGWLRSRALAGTNSNFSLFHRVNKHFHINAGWFAYLAGLVQCYRGLEMVAGSDALVFEAVEIGFTFSNFNVVKTYIFPAWLAIVPPLFVLLECRKQFNRYFTKGAASLCGVVELINEEFTDEAILKEVEDRLMPRTEELPLYTTQEFNDKILNGRSWVIVDGAVLDVSSFAKRHPGGARLILNAMGTDVTSEIIGEEASIGNCSMDFSPHNHTDTALEIARSLVIGYIEEEDDMTDEDGDGDEKGANVDTAATSISGDDSSGRSFENRFRKLSYSMSGSDSERSGGGSEKRLSFSYKSSRVGGRLQSVHFGRLASFGGNSGDYDADARKAQFGAGGGNASGDERRKSFGSGNESGGGDTRRKSFGGQAGGGVVVVGPAVKLSEEAAAIVNVPSPPPVPKNASAPPGGMTAPVSSVESKSQRDKRSPPTRSMSLMGERPVALDLPVNAAPGAETIETSTREKPKDRFKRILRKVYSQMDNPSADEADHKDEDKPFKATRRVWAKRNPLDFFHVCPMIMHEKMGDGAGRPVHKFVFACPGKAAALVDAMEGVCHFNMRLAQEPAMTVVQRSYNAFAVRVMGEEGNRRVVHASETTDGDLCIEMRIRLYPDGVMSNVLSQLIKNLDNPAVQLQGPFLQDKLIPPPAHRNVIMIAAGTGVNPMVQMIRDYLNPASHNDGMLMGAHSRLVLVWQNSIEADFFCSDELTRLQAKAKGLLEVVALVSGDTTRRNVPGNAFRRAKARLIKKGKAALNAASPASTKQGEGCAGKGKGDLPQSTIAMRRETKDGDDSMEELPLHRLRLVPALSRVSEEDPLTRNSKSSSRGGFFGGSERDLESGGGGVSVGARVPSRPTRIGETVEMKEDTVGGIDVRRPWSSRPRINPEDDANANHTLGLGGNATKTSGGVKPGRSQGRHEIVKVTSVDNGMVAEIPPCARGRTTRADRSSDNTNFKGLGRLDKGTGDVDSSSGRRGSSTERAPSRGTGATRSSIRLADSIRQARLERSSADSKKKKGKVDSDSDSSKGGATAMHRSTRPFTGPKTNADAGGVDHSSSDEQGDDKSRRRRRMKTPERPTNSASALPPARPAHVGRARRRAAKVKSAVSGTKIKAPSASPLEDSESGMRSSKVTKEILQKALGPQVMGAVAAARTAAVGVANLERAIDIADGTRATLRELVGTTSSGGRLQIVVSGPAGFVFQVESILAELRIPPEVVVLLD